MKGRIPILVVAALTVALLAAGVTAGDSPASVAWFGQATPAAEAQPGAEEPIEPIRNPPDVPPGVTVEYLTNANSTQSLAGENSLESTRLTIEPGAVATGLDTPGVAIVFVAEGFLKIGVTDGPPLDQVQANPFPYPPSAASGACQSCILDPGESVVIVPGQTVSLENPGDVTTVLYVTALTPGVADGLTTLASIMFCDRSC